MTEKKKNCEKRSNVCVPVLDSFGVEPGNERYFIVTVLPEPMSPETEHTEPDTKEERP